MPDDLTVLRPVRVRLRPVRPVICKSLILFAPASRASGCVRCAQVIDFIVRPVPVECSPIPPYAPRPLEGGARAFLRGENRTAPSENSYFDGSSDWPCRPGAVLEITDENSDGLGFAWRRLAIRRECVVAYAQR